MNPNVPLAPRPTPDTAGFWAATARGELALSRCPTCRRYQHPPLESGRFCATRTEYRAVSGRGVLYSFIVVHRTVAPGYLDRPGHLIGLVELVEQEGPRLASRLVDVTADDVRIGMPTEATIVPLPGSDLRVPMFRPASGGRGAGDPLA